MKRKMATLAAALTVGTGTAFVGVAPAQADTSNPSGPNKTPTAAGCSGTAYAPPSTGKFGKPGYANTTVFGHPGYKQTYTVIAGGDVGAAGVQVKAINSKGAYWRGIGGLASGDIVRVSVPWGNSAAVPAIRAASPVGFPGLAVSFDC